MEIIMMKLKYLSVLLIAPILFAANVKGTPTFPQQIGINRTGVVLQNATEASGFVWNNELYYVYTDRDVAGTTAQMKIVKPALDSNGLITGQTNIATFGSGYGCQDVDVHGSTIYVFATGCKMDLSHMGNSIVKFSSTNLTTWSGPTTIKTMPSNRQAYNVSATENPNTGEYLVAYESTSAAYDWSTKFIASLNATTWVDSGGSWTQTPPEIKYVNNSYYIWGGKVVNGQGQTVMAKTDQGTFTQSRIVAIKPIMEYEDINTTDLDLVEFNGKVYGFYMVGDQSTYMRLTYFTFNGTLAQYVEAYQQPN